ncbi:TPA: hypothetical protein DDZ01_03635 [Candidatus Uhrbacteria bacterium]|nr:MAG: UDP-N-acetylmuramyl-tripeptide synthetase [Candidatus Uhrbacteria bacterium GW2011_GWF2_40_263]HBK35058.1 hypothetical protein [Candidatus Uhrbacteria bacterium]HCB55602.1 hypothetical protein [Candidatus Uhrbacteria bacterium]
MVQFICIQKDWIFQDMIKNLLKKILPKTSLQAYHYILAKLAALFFQHPSEQLIVIGVTGTNGKSSTVQLIGQLLEQMGERVGWTTTASFKVAEKEWINDRKMTMLGRFQTQRLLRRMVRAGCRYAIVETSSQGIEQYRHIGIHYDVAVFTNLTPEHIEAHGGFENYKQAKLKLFQTVARASKKYQQGELVKKIFIANLDDIHAKDFLEFSADKKYGFGFTFSSFPTGVIPFQATDFFQSAEGIQFHLENQVFRSPLVGGFHGSNLLAAVTTCYTLGYPWAAIQQATTRLKSIPGRLEKIDEGQSFTVLVDYAYEPAALRALYESIKVFAYKRLIHVTGSAGGGRDVARRKQIGAFSAKKDDVVIVTNEDPYDEDPWEIINAVADAANEQGKEEGVTLYRILDRQEAITFAISLAKEGDLVLITGKGSEPVMAVARGKKIPWDDRLAVRKALQQL